MSSDDEIILAGAPPPDVVGAAAVDDSDDEDGVMIAGGGGGHTEVVAPKRSRAKAVLRHGFFFALVVVAHCISDPIAFGGDPFCKMDGAVMMDVIGIIKLDWEFLGKDAVPDRDAPAGKRDFLGWLDYTVGELYPFTEKLQVTVERLRRWSGKSLLDDTFDTAAIQGELFSAFVRRLGIEVRRPIVLTSLEAGGLAAGVVFRKVPLFSMMRSRFFFLNSLA